MEEQIRIEDEEDYYRMSKEEAQAMIDKITGDPTHAYNNENAAIHEHERAVALVNRYYEIVAGKEDSVKGHLNKLHEEKQQLMKDRYGYLPGEDWSSSNGGTTNRSCQQPDVRPISENIGWGDKEVKSGFGQRIQDA